MDKHNISESSSDDDDDPYNFVLQLTKLQEKRKQKKVSEKNNDHTKSTSLNTVDSNDIAKIMKEFGPTCSETTNASTSKASTSKTSTSKASTSKASTSKASTSRATTSKATNSKTKEKILGPVICIGDFDDGYDMPPPKQHDNIIEDDLGEDMMAAWRKRCALQDEEAIIHAQYHREINLKVHWRKMRVYKFEFRRFQKIDSVYDFFAKLENISTVDVVLHLNDKLLSPSDSPDSMDYKIVDFIEGSIDFYQPMHSIIMKRNAAVPSDVPSNEINFRIKQEGVRHPLTIGIKKNDKMHVLYIKIAEELKLDLNSFTLVFDGDKIELSDTIESLELEGNECIDLFKKTKL